MSASIDPDRVAESKARVDAFTEAARPLMKWMAENLHPHHVAHVESNKAELFEGAGSTGTINDYVRD